jgi:hypothetical protein
MSGTPTLSRSHASAASDVVLGPEVAGSAQDQHRRNVRGSEMQQALPVSFPKSFEHNDSLLPTRREMARGQAPQYRA